MPCMCGDLYCHSCGPAQGNSRCPECGVWTADGGCENSQQCEEATRLADEAYYTDIEEADRLAEEYWKEEDKRWQEENIPSARTAPRPSDRRKL
jgi:hypothetical protein